MVESKWDGEDFLKDAKTWIALTSEFEFLTDGSKSLLWKNLTTLLGSTSVVKRPHRFVSGSEKGDTFPEGFLTFQFQLKRY